MRAILFAAVVIASSGLVAQRGTRIVPDSVKADPKHYTVEAENELVRVLRVKYGPGEKSVMHTHPAGCGIFMADQNFKFTTPDGKTHNDLARAGEVRCGDAETHLPENVGQTAAEVVILEFKNRQTFKK